MVSIGMDQWSPTSCLKSHWLPVSRGQHAEIILVGHSRETHEDVFQIGEWVFAVSLTRHDQGVKDRRALAGVGVADKQAILFPDAGRPDGVLNQVIVQATFAMVQMGDERVPLV